MNKYWMRAIGVGISVTITALLVFEKPPEIALWWQPVLLGIQAALAQAGFNAVSKAK